VLANSGVVWASVAFLIGTVLPTRTTAAIGAAAALVLASFSYYAAAATLGNVGFSERGVLVWSVGGLIAGTVFGFAGQLVVDKRTRQSLPGYWRGSRFKRARTCCGSSDTRCCARRSGDAHDWGDDRCVCHCAGCDRLVATLASVVVAASASALAGIAINEVFSTI
jgi:hypothetical protein